MEGADLIYKKGEPEEEIRHIDINGFFLAIGHKPNTDLFADYLTRDEEGYIVTEGDSPRTNVPGVYAAGDCADPHYRQAVVAAGSGCKAAMEAEKYIQNAKLKKHYPCLQRTLETKLLSYWKEEGSTLS